MIRVGKDKEDGKKKINSFLKDRVSLFTSQYKEKIKQEEEEARILNREVQVM